MKVLDLGCGFDDERFIPGADLADDETDLNGVENEGYGKGFIQFVSTDTPLPVEDNTYNVVWYSNGFYYVPLDKKKKVADEIKRVLCNGGILVIHDYTVDDNSDREATEEDAIKWRETVEKTFEGWEIEFIGFEDNFIAVASMRNHK